jgi:transposase
METVYFLGIDVSKKKLDAALTLDGVNMYEKQIENSPAAIKSFIQLLQKEFSFRPSQLVVCLEHTGIYCQPFLDFAVSKKINVCLEPALQIKQSQGMTRGKNDQVDAKRIAAYAYKNRQELKFWKPQRLALQKLKTLLVIRERLIKMRVQLEVPINETKEFLEISLRTLAKSQCNKTLKAVLSDIAGVDKQIDLLIKEDTQLCQQMKWATSVPGVGKITAANVIIDSGELERISDVKKFACYAGIAPFEHRSGSSIRGKTRVSKMANMTIKRLLHLAAMSAIQCCEELKIYYHRKLAEGKNKMSVLNAVRNKLISRIFACLKAQRPYQKTYSNALA